MWRNLSFTCFWRHTIQDKEEWVRPLYLFFFSVSLNINYVFHNWATFLFNLFFEFYWKSIPPSTNIALRSLYEECLQEELKMEGGQKNLLLGRHIWHQLVFSVLTVVTVSRHVWILIVDKLLVFRIQFKGDLLTASPDIYITELGPNAEFILLASDGLWDYMKTFVSLSLYISLFFFIW